ncbi:hypothetical protein [Solitalea lacus]|uniref:hypothetical protein n=1 Tax=Solitalea lacus TaxID=2911172 RepID=UPI001EDB9195|nr:hypothetical protein [Solitalea lacus]UKJ05992.1 hypothetical protein L2B55_10585 [Solitalea lacus]
MKILKKLFLGIIAILVLLVVVSLFLPSTYKVERSAVIKAPVAKVFNEFNDLNNWPNWNAFDDEFTDKIYNLNT